MSTPPRLQGIIAAGWRPLAIALQDLIAREVRQVRQLTIDRREIRPRGFEPLLDVADDAAAVLEPIDWIS